MSTQACLEWFFIFLLDLILTTHIVVDVFDHLWYKYFVPLFNQSNDWMKNYLQKNLFDWEITLSKKAMIIASAFKSNFESSSPTVDTLMQVSSCISINKWAFIQAIKRPFLQNFAAGPISFHKFTNNLHTHYYSCYSFWLKKTSFPLKKWKKEE